MLARDTRKEQLTLELLDAIDRRSDLSQRRLASQLGVALGLANSYLRRCIRKGYVKVSEAPANRYLYYLTPTGFSEKARLTSRYLSISFDFYRQAGRSCNRIYENCVECGIRRLVLCGISDLAEIAVLRAIDFDIEIVGVFDRTEHKSKFLSKPVWGRWGELPRVDGAVVTDVTTPLATVGYLRSKLPSQRVLAPDMLRIE
ncbi:MAG: winged helix-turn-helix transcriptional regulator [Gammaproteobacteria bacterium]|nr:winged helix-turn-helix transcriptional regulator [Gammaproteobacteria bacterium]MDH3468207.1 winged helix-turn-helix transcriptional regulator [Gammaproteobacteria bacterium]